MDPRIGRRTVGLVNICFWSQLRIKNRWDNFKNTQWDSMGPPDKVGQRNYLKFRFSLTPPLGTFGQN
jgi:hypothetical protein